MKKNSLIISAFLVTIVLIITSTLLYLDRKALKGEVERWKESNRIWRETATYYEKESERCVESWQERNNTVTSLTESVLRLKKLSDSLSRFAVNRN